MTSTNVALSPRVTDFLWEEGRPPPRNIEQVLAEDPSCAWLGTAHGQFAAHYADPNGNHTLVRDELGVNKLFFTIGSNGTIASSNYRYDLLGANDQIIWSVPAGHAVRISPSDRSLRLERWSTLQFAAESPLTLAEHGAQIRARLNSVFRDIRTAVAGRPLYVTLSGGLDSTTIAVLAQELIGDFTAVTFALEPAAGARKAATVHEDSDLRHARQVAQLLGVPALEVTADPESVLALLDTTLIYGQDFRDFNVHCGLVNAAIGAAISARHPSGPRPVLLTGDTMNELMADYSPEVHRGTTIYPLPRLARGRMRSHLVRGLDAGDREVGIFNHQGFDTIQPYALCAKVYAALPDAVINSPGSKSMLARAVMGRQVPESVYLRPKVRAQVGGPSSAGSPGGTMGLLLDRGIDGAWLAARFATLFRMSPAEVRRSILVGRYRSPTAYPTDIPQ